MRHAFAPVLLLTACSGLGSKVDSRVVGTWDVTVPNAQGIARWVWEIHRDGTYAFHAEGPGDVPSHSGTFAARDGHYTLLSTTMVWADTGTYQLVGTDTLSATGKLGTAAWHRVQPAVVPTDSVADAGDDTTAVAPGVVYVYLHQHSLGDSLVLPPFSAPRPDTATIDAQNKEDGVIGIVRTAVHGPTSSNEVSFVIYRNPRSARLAFAANAMYDSSSFQLRMPPGEVVVSHGYSFHERGEAYCLSRHMMDRSSDAPVTCYLLVQYPAREPVIIEARRDAQLVGTAEELPIDVFTNADDLLLAGLKQWEVAWAGMGM